MEVRRGEKRRGERKQGRRGAGICLLHHPCTGIISVASRVLLLAQLLLMLQPSTLGDFQPTSNSSPLPLPVTTLGQRRPFLTSRPTRGSVHVTPVPSFKGRPQHFEPIPFYVMLQLDTVDPETNVLKDPEILYEQLSELKKAGVEGVMVDVWWGIVEREGPGMYDWSAYMDLVQMVAGLGLKLQAVMSFHQCGGNIGDACFIALPKWVLAVGNENPDIFYTDAGLSRNIEYLSLGVDDEKLFDGLITGIKRSPVDMYGDFMASFAKKFIKFMPHVITEAQIGMGPAGELRYPSYPLNQWQWPGIGQFQCYDQYLRKNLITAATKAKKPEYGLMFPPHYDLVGGYNHTAESTQFFKNEGGTWNTTEGDFFLKWYSDNLIKHGDRVLTRARRAFKSTGIHIAAKVAGIHWHYDSKSHAPELTAGYYNTVKRDGYADIAKMMASHKALFDFTCLEMRDRELPDWAFSRPVELVEQTMRAAHKHKAGYAGENALPRYDRCAYEQMLSQCTHEALKADGTVKKGAAPGSSINGFTYLRLGSNLLDQGRKWSEFSRFAQEMSSGFHFPRWGSIPQERQSRRGSVTQHLEIHVDQDVSKLMAMYTAEGKKKPGRPGSIVGGGTPFSKVPRVTSGIQAGVRAGQNGRPLIPAQTVRFSVVTDDVCENKVSSHLLDDTTSFKF